jgi:hypothetical protein
MMQSQSAMLAFVDCFWVPGIVFLAVIPLKVFVKSAGAAQGPIVME